MAEDPDSERSWFEYRRLVLGALDRIDGQISAVNNKLDAQDGIRGKEIADLRVEVGMLKVKAAMWGVASGAGVSGIVNVLMSALRHS